MVGFKRPACQQGVATASEKALPHHAPGISSLFVLIQSQLLLTHQVLFLAGLASAVPAPEADPLLYTGHPLTYAVPYVTYHAPKCETEFEEVKGQSCVTKPVTECNDVEVPSHKIVTEDVCQNVTTAECTHSTYSAGVYYGKREAEADPQVLVGAVPAVVPYHTCENKVTEVCYPVQKVEPTTITEKSCLVSVRKNLKIYKSNLNRLSPAEGRGRVHGGCGGDHPQGDLHPRGAHQARR